MGTEAVALDALGEGARIGSYVIVRPIAEGGMGAVYEAEHRITKQRRALKVVRPELASKSDFRVRFVREVTIASAVRHPNLVDTQDPIEEGGMLALPMELLEGETLSARLRRGRLAIAEAVEILVPCARAVHAVHERSVIHRDLKPLNIFLAAQGGRVVPKVLDFGAAREIADDEHTRTGLVIGSPFYMAPEQAEGRKDLDVRVDVYAMGVIAYFCLTGRRLYETDSAQSAIAKLLRGEKYPRLCEIDASIPRGIEAAVLKAIAYERDDRWDTLAAFADALVAGHAGESVGDATSSDPEATLLRDPIAPEPSGPASASGVRASAHTSTSGITPGAFAAPPPAEKAVSGASGTARSSSGLAIVAGGAIVIAALVAGWWITRAPTSPPATEIVQRVDSPSPSPPPSRAVAVEVPSIVPPPSMVALPASSVPAVEAIAPPPPSTPIVGADRRASSTGGSRRHVSGAPSGEPGPSGSSSGPPPSSSAPCGIDIGIPCID